MKRNGLIILANSAILAASCLFSAGLYAFDFGFYGNAGTVSNDDPKKFPFWGMDNFGDSKELLKKITKMHPKSFYCDCDINFSKNGKKLGFDFSSCGFNYRKNEARANRAEAEHIVPISWYGKKLRCWQNGGRKNCERTSEVFRKAEADLVNLQYAIGEVNGDRSDYRYGQWSSDYGKVYGSCDAKVDFKNRQFEPRYEIRGWIARVHYYMYSKYGIDLSKQQKELMSNWIKIKPTKWECDYNKELKRRFGSGAGNPYTDRVCLN